MKMHQNADDGLKRRFLSVTRCVASLLFSLMEANNTTSMRLSAVSALLRQQQQQNTFGRDDDDYTEVADDNGWLQHPKAPPASPLSRADAIRMRKRTNKLMLQMVSIIHTFLDAYFELVYVSDVNDFVIRLREWSSTNKSSPQKLPGQSPTTTNNSQLDKNAPPKPSSCSWPQCQAIIFLNRIDAMFYRKASDELEQAIGNGGASSTSSSSNSEEQLQQLLLRRRLFDDDDEDDE